MSLRSITLENVTHSFMAKLVLNYSDLENIFELCHSRSDTDKQK